MNLDRRSILKALGLSPLLYGIPKLDGGAFCRLDPEEWFLIDDKGCEVEYTGYARQFVFTEWDQITFPMKCDPGSVTVAAIGVFGEGESFARILDLPIVKHVNQNDTLRYSP